MSSSYGYHRENRTARYDGHGIFLTYTCPKCERRKMAEFREDILEHYPADEPIDALD